jgi:plasmid stabilization system protein ParE
VTSVISPRYADFVVHRLVAAVERLEAFPQSGRVVPERNDEAIREVIVRPYRIVYRLRPGLAEIVTVFRASRLFPEADRRRGRLMTETRAVSTGQEIATAPRRFEEAIRLQGVWLTQGRWAPEFHWPAQEDLSVRGTSV